MSGGIPAITLRTHMLRMVAAAGRRMSDDQVDATAHIWANRLPAASEAIVAAVAETFILDAQWPSLRDFRARLAARIPRPPEQGPPDYPHCPKGHHLRWRQYTGTDGLARQRMWCVCEDRAAAFYGHTWGEYVD